MDFNIFLRRYKFLLFRLKDVAKRSERNPGRSLGGSDGITTLPERQYTF
jgi:hypothetical protein